MRASCKYVSYKHIKAFAADLKRIYRAANAEQALEGLMQVKEAWAEQYPSAVKSWEDNWEHPRNEKTDGAVAPQVLCKGKIARRLQFNLRGKVSPCPVSIPYHGGAGAVKAKSAACLYGSGSPW